MRSALARCLLAAACLSAPSALARGTPVTVAENFETAAPGAINGQTTSSAWSDPRITALTAWRGTTGAARTAVFADDAVAGNSTRKGMLDAVTPPAPGFDFSFGFRAEFYTHQDPPRRARFEQRLGQPVRTSSDVFLSNAGELWTVETVSMSQGFITDRVFMNWSCEDYPDICLSFGNNAGEFMPMSGFGYDSCPECVPFTIFVIFRYMDRAPVGASVGDPVSTPVGSWFRVIHEFTLNGRVRTILDFLDGQGEFVVRDSSHYFPDLRTDSYGANGAFETVGSPMYMDNITVFGDVAICDGDANGDGLIDFADLNITLNQYSSVGTGLGGDFNGDRRVDFADLNILLGRFNHACD